MREFNLYVTVVAIYITISEEERKEGGDELTGVNWGPVDPATHQATKIACGVRTWIEDVQFFQK